MDEEGIVLDAFSRELMQKLMQTEEFQELWVDLAKTNPILEKNSEAKERHNEKRGLTEVTHRRKDNSNPNEFAVPKVHLHDTHSGNKTSLGWVVGRLVEDQLRQFVRAIHLAMAAFADGTQMARFEDQLPSKNMQSQEPVTLYMAHIRLEKFYASECFHVAKFSLAARQIANLLRTFTLRVSCIYSLERCSFLADSLFRLLSKFHERIQRHFRQSPHGNEIAKFGAEIRKFGTFVCRSLREKLTVNRPHISQTAHTVRRGLRLNWPSADTFPILINSKANNQIKGGRRGFLLSPELDFDRRRIAAIATDNQSSKNRAGGDKYQNAKPNCERKQSEFGRDLLRLARPTEVAALRQFSFYPSLPTPNL